MYDFYYELGGEKPKEKPIKVEVEKKVKPQPKERVRKDTDDNKSSDLAYLKKLLDNLPITTDFEYREWSKIPWACYNMVSDKDAGYLIFDKWASEGKKYNKEKEKYDYYYPAQNDHYKDTNVNKNYLLKLIKKYNKDGFDEELKLDAYDLAVKIKEEYKDEIIIQSDEQRKTTLFYVYDGKYWRSSRTLMNKIATKVIKDEVGRITRTLRDDVINFCADELENNRQMFDTKRHLLAFENKVLDLTTGIFREPAKDDFISLTTEYNYREPTEDETKELDRILKRIFPIEEERKYIFSVFATALTGENDQHVYIFSGTGGNGKGWISRLICRTLGEQLSIEGKTAILTEKSKTGCNVELANLKSKRYVVFKEPPARMPIQNEILKELTGGDKIQARGLYDSRTAKQNNMTVCIECNDKPPLESAPGRSDERRARDAPFRSEFFDKDKLEKEVENLENKTFQYWAENIDTDEKRDELKFAFVKLLINHAIEYYKNDKQIVVPQSIIERTNQWFNTCDIATNWFTENYTFVEDGEDKPYLQLKDVFDDFKKSEVYNLLSSREKRVYNYNKLVKVLSQSPTYKKYYEDKYRPYVDGEQLTIRNVIFNYKKIVTATINNTNYNSETDI